MNYETISLIGRAKFERDGLKGADVVSVAASFNRAAAAGMSTPSRLVQQMDLLYKHLLFVVFIGNIVTQFSIACKLRT